MNPYLSPDGKYLTTSKQLVVGTELYLLERSTGQERLIGRYEALDGVHPSHWFASGDSILITGGLGSGIQEYHVVRVDGSGTVPFSFAPAANADYLAVSNNGRWLALGREPGNEADSKRIDVYDLVRQVLVREIILPHSVGHLAWSPDGGFLAHVPSPVLGRQAILEILIVGTGERIVLVPDELNGPSGYFPTWVR